MSLPENEHERKLMGSMASAGDSSPAAGLPWWMLLLCAAVSLVGIFDRDLWTPDEPRVAAISLEMSRTRNYALPHLAGEPFVEQPPLYYAVAAGAAGLLGPLVGETGAIRLTSALWGLATLAVVFLMARRLLGRRSAVIAAAMLATMGGFVENTHWIRVDAALLFFVAAALWSLCEVYVGNRPWHLLTAGAFAAGAFLVKGMVGPMLIGVGGLGLFVPWLIRRLRERNASLFIPHHVMCLLLFAVVAGLWMAAFRATGGPDLWHRWLWDNQFGRFLGQAPDLGHVKARQPFFYIAPAATYTLPWLPLVVLWLGRIVGDLRKRRALPVWYFFLLSWAVGGIVLLSLSVSKRSIYLLPLLPAFAVMSAEAADRGIPPWCKAFFIGCIGLLVVAVAAMTASSLIAAFLPDAWLGRMAPFLKSFSPRHAVGLAGLAACLCLFARCRRGLPLTALMVAFTAVFHICFYAMAAKAMDYQNSMKADFASFSADVPAESRSRIAAWNFSETERGAFYYYSDWKVPVIGDTNRVRRIIAGADTQFDKVIVAGKCSLPDLFPTPYRVARRTVFTRHGHDGNLSLVEGTTDAGAGPKTNSPKDAP